MSRLFDRKQTLDELDPPAWGEPKCDSYLTTTSHSLRRKPLVDFTTEDLRIMIGQGIGLRWLVPLALDLLEKDPLAAGDFYSGDLLAAVLRVRQAFWSQETECHARAKAVVARVSGVTKELSEAVAQFRAGAA
jgi:hypothetical protein